MSSELCYSVMQLWRRCDPQTAIPCAFGVINTTNLRHLVHVFLQYTMTQSGGGFFSGEQQIFFCFLFFLYKMSWSLNDVAVCNVEARNCASNHAAVSTNTPGMTSNRLCVRWQLERPVGRASSDHHTSSTQQDLLHRISLGGGEDQFRNCVSSSGPERIVNTIWTCTSHIERQLPEHTLHIFTYDLFLLTQSCILLGYLK